MGSTNKVIGLGPAYQNQICYINLRCNDGTHTWNNSIYVSTFAQFAFNSANNILY